MCLAVPMKLISIEGTAGIAEQGGVSIPVNLMLMETLKIGDYIIVHAGFAIQKMSEEEALETIEIYRECYQAQTSDTNE